MIELLKPDVISKVMIKNLKKCGNPIGLKNYEINKWWDGLKVGKHCRILFTGMMYQLAPYIIEIAERLYRIENSFLENFFHVLVHLPPSLTKVFIKPKSQDVSRFNTILVNIYRMLSKSGVDFGYNPKLDFYSGILLYDLGLDDVFEEHARKVSKKLVDAGVKEVITVDPHTTYALSELYPEYTGVEFKVKSYLELVRGKTRENVTIHDPCYYARYLDFYDQPRDLLRSAGAECVEVRNSKKMTYCCGAPIESITPKLSYEIAKIRYSELSETGCKIVTMCPLCLARLKTFGEVYDISEVLSGD